MASPVAIYDHHGDRYYYHYCYYYYYSYYYCYCCDYNYYSCHDDNDDDNEKQDHLYFSGQHICLLYGESGRADSDEERRAKERRQSSLRSICGKLRRVAALVFCPATK